MQTEIKSFTVAGGAAFLAAKYVFDASTRKAAMWGIAGGLVVVAMLQIKIPVPGLTPPAVDKNNSPVTHPEVDNSGKTNTPENLPPISFASGKPLNGNVAGQLENEAVKDWDIAWGDNPYKAQNPTISGV